MKTKIKNNKAFTAALSDIRKSGRELRAMAQNVVLYGFEHYAAHGDVEFLNRAFKACIGEAKLDTKQMGAYITAHCNVALAEPTKPKVGFKKSGKGAASYKEPTVEWFDFERESGSGADTTLDQIKALERFIATMTDNYGNNKYENNIQACELVKTLTPIVDRMNREKKHLKEQAVVAIAAKATEGAEVVATAA